MVECGVVGAPETPNEEVFSTECWAYMFNFVHFQFQKFELLTKRMVQAGTLALLTDNQFTHKYTKHKHTSIGRLFSNGPGAVEKQHVPRVAAGVGRLCVCPSFGAVGLQNSYLNPLRWEVECSQYKKGGPRVGKMMA